MPKLGQSVSRRAFIQRAAIGAVGVSTAGFWIKHLIQSQPHAVVPMTEFSADPIFKLQSLEQTQFSGDQYHRAHTILWAKAAYIAAKGGIPPVSETTDVVVLGGGLAGLTAAYQLRAHKPILLEQASQFGGNARGERWGTTQYGIGSAYMTPPEKGGRVDRFFQELGIAQDYRIDTTSIDWGHSHFQGKLMRGFWDGVTDPSRAEEFRRVYRKLVHILEHAYPEIPWRPGSKLTKAEHDRLDRLPFSDWMQQELAPMHPHVEEFLHEYCWSSCGGQANELSSAQVLNFIASDIHSIAVFPGGNAAVSQALYTRLISDLGADRLRAGCFVIDVKANAEGVQVCFETADGVFKTLQARTAVIGAPKFIVRKWMDDLPDAQEDAIAQLEYRSAIVSNVLIETPRATPAYDMYRLEGKKVSDPATTSRERPYTDIVYGTWAAADRTDHSVLTLYRMLPYPKGRTTILPENTYAKMRAEVEATLPPLLESLGYSMKDYRGLRLTRWGHPIPLGRVGFLADGVLARACAPIAGRIFFANQDNAGSPCFESAFKAALAAAQQVDQVLSQSNASQESQS